MQTIEELHRRLSAACRSTGIRDYEIIFINDGSEDSTWQVIERICETDHHVVGIDLVRNHGHQLALTVGLETALGDVIFMLDADLQHPPELLGEMLEVMDREKSDVVYGSRKKRRDVENFFKRYSSTVFYRILDYLSDTAIPHNASDFRLVHRRVVDVLNQMPERHRFIRGMIAWIGFKQVPFYYDVAPRFAGKTKYSLKRMTALAVDAFTGFSIVPLRLASAIGVISGTGAILLIIYTLIGYAFLNTEHGWTSIMGVILLFASIQMFFLGIIGEYLGRLFIQSKNRPLYIIRQIRRTRALETTTRNRTRIPKLRKSSFTT